MSLIQTIQQLETEQQQEEKESQEKEVKLTLQQPQVGQNNVFENFEETVQESLDYLHRNRWLISCASVTGALVYRVYQLIFDNATQSNRQSSPALRGSERGPNRDAGRSYPAIRRRTPRYPT